MIERLIGNARAAAAVFMTEDPGAARQLLGEKEVFREIETRATEAHFGVARDGRSESVEAGRLHLDIVRDLKRVNAHLAAAAYPILEGRGELLPSRLRQTPNSRDGLSAAGCAAPSVAATDVADRNSRNASLTLAFAQPGDTLLYLLLPLHHAAFGVSLAEAGLLLAANRLVRIAGYGWVARFYAERGPRAACLLAAFGSLLSTLGYATLSGVWALLIARLLWGLSFAAMNIATQALATAEPTGAARRSGRMRAIIAAGPVSGLIVGAVVSQLAGPRAAFLVLAARPCSRSRSPPGSPSRAKEDRSGYSGRASGCRRAWIPGPSSRA